MKKLIRKVIKHLYWMITEHKKDLISRKYLIRANENGRRGKVIKVVFVVQMPEIWDKQSKVFDLMKKDKRFSPQLVVAPKYDFVNDSVGEYGEELDFFISYDENTIKIDDVNDVNSFFDQCDYVFYQRKYDIVLPEILRSENLVKHTKICYIPYATPELKKTELYSKDFYRNVYMAFMESQFASDLLKKKFKYNSRNKIQNFLFEGYPPYEIPLSQRIGCQYKNILWAPRWSYDPVAGGSHFFEYKRQVNDYAQNHSNVNVYIRPHPLMFDNFIKENRITQAEVEQYKKETLASGVSFDNNKDINVTFENTDILISDRSSIIPMFFLTGKPIIYCPVDIEYGYLYNIIMPGLYIADNWNELFKILGELIEGKDKLKDIREQIINGYFILNKDASQKIVNTIYSDYTNKIIK